MLMRSSWTVQNNKQIDNQIICIKKKIKRRSKEGHVKINVRFIYLFLEASGQLENCVRI